MHEAAIYASETPRAALADYPYVGKSKFDFLPRVGETVFLPDPDGPERYNVRDVTHAPTGDDSEYLASIFIVLHGPSL